MSVAFCQRTVMSDVERQRPRLGRVAFRHHGHLNEEMAVFAWLLAKSDTCDQINLPWMLPEHNISQIVEIWQSLHLTR